MPRFVVYRGEGSFRGAVDAASYPVEEHRCARTAVQRFPRHSGIHHIWRLTDHGTIHGWEARIVAERNPGVHQRDVAEHGKGLESAGKESQRLARLELHSVVDRLTGIRERDDARSRRSEEYLLDRLVELLSEHGNAQKLTSIRVPLPPHVHVADEGTHQLGITDNILRADNVAELHRCQLAILRSCKGLRCRELEVLVVSEAVVERQRRKHIRELRRGTLRSADGWISVQLHAVEFHPC